MSMESSLSRLHTNLQLNCLTSLKSCTSQTFSMATSVENTFASAQKRTKNRYTSYHSEEQLSRNVLHAANVARQYLVGNELYACAIIYKFLVSGKSLCASL